MIADIALTVTISKSEYDQLLRDSLWLNCLECAGVDNWDGYDYAIEDFQERIGDEDGEDNE